jgi:transcriptional regulator with XRE-family HTH domain
LTSSSDLTIEQRQILLGTRLRQLRHEAALSAAQLGSAVGWSRSKASKIENGRTMPTVDDIRTWLDQCGADDAARDEVLAAARELTALTMKRRQLHARPTKQKHDRPGGEEKPCAIGTYGPHFVPYLLQTPDYLRCLLELGGQADADIPAILVDQLNQQTTLFDETIQIDVTMTEAALRWHPGSTAVALAQLDRIATLAELPTMSISVLPCAEQEIARMTVPFLVGRYPDGVDHVVLDLGMLTGTHVVRDPAVVAVYQQFLAEQQDRAIRGSELTALLAGISAELRRRVSPSLRPRRGCCRGPAAPRQ